MICPNCGHTINDGQAFCEKCGAAMSNQQSADSIQPQQPSAQPQKAQPAPVVPGRGLGLASTILGSVAVSAFCIIWLSFICAVVGVVLGAVSIKQARSVNAKSGIGLAGLICSSIVLGIQVIIVLSFFGTYLTNIW